MEAASCQACKQFNSTRKIQPTQLNFGFSRDNCCNLHEWEGEIHLNFKHSLITTKAVSGFCFHLRHR